MTGRAPAGALVELRGVRSLLFVRLGKLGDLMVCSGLFVRARQRYPNMRLGLLTLPRSVPLFKHNQDLDLVLAWRPWNLPALALRERWRAWDLLVDLNDAGSRRTVLAKRLIHAKHSVAFRNARTLAAFDTTVAAPDSARSHVLDRLERMALALGLGSRQPLRPSVSLDPVALKLARRFRASAGARVKVVSLNLSAGHPSRYWGAAKWQALASALVKASPRVRLRLLFAPLDIVLAQTVASGLPAGTTLASPGSSLDDFLAAIACSDMLISPDTSAIHAAGAAKVPVLGLYPAPQWNYASWRPRGPHDIALRASHDGVDQIALEPARRAALKLLKAIL